MQLCKWGCSGLAGAGKGSEQVGGARAQRGERIRQHAGVGGGAGEGGEGLLLRCSCAFGEGLGW